MEPKLDQSLSNLEPLRGFLEQDLEAIIPTKENSEQEWIERFTDILVSVERFRSPSPPNKDPLQMSFSLSSLWTSDLRRCIGEQTQLQCHFPFPNPNTVNRMDIINYELALEGDTISNIAKTVAKDMLPWAWECLNFVSSPGTLFYLGLMIARLFFSIRYHNYYNVGDKITICDPSAPLDATFLLGWTHHIHAILDDVSPDRNRSSITPHVAVFAWVCWEYVDYFRCAAALPLPVLELLCLQLGSSAILLGFRPFLDIIEVLLRTISNNEQMKRDLVYSRRRDIFSHVERLFQEYCPLKLSQDVGDMTIKLITASIDLLSAIGLENNDEKWCEERNERSHHLFPLLARCLVPMDYRDIHRLLANAAIRLSIILLSGPISEMEVGASFFSSGLHLSIRNHAIISRFYPSWLNDSTKTCMEAFDNANAKDTGQFGDEKQRLFCLRVQDWTRLVPNQSPSIAIHDYGPLLDSMFTPYGLEAISASLDLMLPFNNRKIDAEWLFLFLRSLLSPIHPGPFEGEVLWKEACSTKAIASMEPNHALSWTQAYNLLCCMGVEPHFAKEEVRKWMQDSRCENNPPPTATTPAMVLKRDVSSRISKILAESVREPQPSSSHAILFKNILRPSFIEFVESTTSIAPFPDWFDLSIAFIIRWQEAVSKRVGFNCTSLAFACLRVNLPSSMLPRWLLLQSCAIPFPTMEYILFNISYNFDLSPYWTHKGKRYHVKFDPGTPNWSIQRRFFQCNRDDARWICPAQHDLNDTISASTLSRLGARLGMRLAVSFKTDPERFTARKLMLRKGTPLMSLLPHATQIQLLEQVVQLPGIRLAYYDLNKQKWHVEMAEETNVEGDPRFTDFIIDKQPPTVFVPMLSHISGK